jgi:hypothetical protein
MTDPPTPQQAPQAPPPKGLGKFLLWLGADGYRPVCGVASIAVYLLRFRYWADDSLPLAILLLGLVILASWGLDHLWGWLGNASGAQDEASEEAALAVAGKALKEGFQQVAGAIIAVAGILLGLLAAFDKGPLSLALKVGSAALALALLLALVLNFIVGLDVPGATGPVMFLGIYTNVLFWTLSLGLLCLLMALILRT